MLHETGVLRQLDSTLCPFVTDDSTNLMFHDTTHSRDSGTFGFLLRSVNWSSTPRKLSMSRTYVTAYYKTSTSFVIILSSSSRVYLVGLNESTNCIILVNLPCFIHLDLKKNQI